MERKPFTATGDAGETSTAKGRTAKDSAVVNALGAIDELVSFLGLARTKLSETPEVESAVAHVQRTLFRYAAVVHSMRGSEITEDDVRWLEQKAVEFDRDLPQLRRFILPGGGEGGAALHVARAVCRRAERYVVALNREKGVCQHCIPYINRLSSLLFVLARYVNIKEGRSEELV